MVGRREAPGRGDGVIGAGLVTDAASNQEGVPPAGTTSAPQWTQYRCVPTGKLVTALGARPQRAARCPSALHDHLPVRTGPRFPGGL